MAKKKITWRVRTACEQLMCLISRQVGEPARRSLLTFHSQMSAEVGEGQTTAGHQVGVGTVNICLFPLAALQIFYSIISQAHHHHMSVHSAQAITKFWEKGSSKVINH